MQRRFHGSMGEEFLVVRSSAVLSGVTESDAMAMLRAAFEDDATGAQLMAMVGTDDPERAREILARALVSGALTLVRLEGGPRLLDPPRTVPISHWSDDPDPVEPVTPKARTQTWFEARVVDPWGTPLSGIDVVLDHDGDTHRLRTDGDGRVRLDPAHERSATVWIGPSPALCKALESAWAQLETGPMLTAEDDVEVLHHRDELMGPVRLRAEQPQTLSIQPFVVLGRMVGMFFDTERDFLLPISREAISEMKALHDRCVPCRVLVVGHTDTVGDFDDNAELSLSRAKSVRAFLTDDVDAWLVRYDSAAPGAGKWGEAEDRHMLEALPDWAQRPKGSDPVRWFQQTRGLVDDGKAGPQTRRTLIGEYMGLDGTTLPAGVHVEVHGCGEAFPLAASGHELDEAPLDGNDDPLDRRVELFFFGDSLGIQPPPPGSTSGAGSQHYPVWRNRAMEVYQRVVGPQTLEIELLDEHDRPIAHARYTVRLAVGAVVDGELDERGRARIERLPPGVVRVDFPELGRGFLVASTGALEGGGS
jgi:hypothetical protein